MIDLQRISGFDWDEGNARKNEKHGVSMAEAEQVFFNAPLLVLQDGTHSQDEVRLHALGKSHVHLAPVRRVDSCNFSPRYAPKGADDL